MTYQELKDIFVAACHEQHACTDGFKEVLAADNAGMLAMAMRHHWDDCYNGAFYDAIKSNINNIGELTDDFANAEIFFNKSSTHGIVVINDCSQKYLIHGNAECYVYDKCNIDLYENAQAYCKISDSNVFMAGKSHSVLENQKNVVVKDYSSAELKNCEAICFNKPIITATDCTIDVYDFSRIEAFGSTNIILHGDTAITKDNASKFNLILNDASTIIYK